MIAAGGCATIKTAALGIRAIGKLSYLAVPVLIGGLVYALATLLDPAGVGKLIQYRPMDSVALSVGSAAATVAGGFIVGAAMNSDYSRFAPNQFHAIGYAVSDYALVYPSLLIACGIIAITSQSKDINDSPGSY